MTTETFLDGRVAMHIGDVREKLRAMPADHFDCVVTSPPYWGLRDYGVDGQIGLEPTLGEHLAVMVDVFEEVRRVLKPAGTLWLNYGDCYATSPNGRSAADTKAVGNDDRTFRDKPFSTIGKIYPPTGDDPFNRAAGGRRGGGLNSDPSLKAKDLCMIPNRLAIALQEAGWWVRSEIIWHKPNPMPESIRDRPTTSHEKIWLLTKSERYFYDADAIAEPSVKAGIVLHTYGTGAKDRQDVSDVNDRRTRIGLANWNKACPDTKNIRNVWSIPTAAYSEAHFATFPPEIPERCIKAGSPLGGEILDPFGGSGTTAMVAASLGRKATLIELNPGYATLARARIEAAFMGKEEGARHMIKSLGKLAVDAGPLFATTG
jgi:DNA modification methylase